MSEGTPTFLDEILSRTEVKVADLSVRDVAELLWLRARINAPLQPPSQLTAPTPQHVGGESPRSFTAEGARLLRASSTRALEVTFADQQTSRPTPIFQGGGGARVTVHIDAAQPLERRLAYTRGLTRLARTGTDRHRMVLDVSATIRQTCQAMQLRTVVQARSRAITNLVVLVDSAGQLDPWRAGIRQLAATIGQARGFANQTFLEVDAGNATELRFWSAPLGARGREEVRLESTFRHGLDNLYVLVTDGVGDSMVNGAWGRALTDLSIGATAVWMHPWPETHWPRSGLGRLRAAVPAPLSPRPRSACVPIVEFSPEGIASLEAWRQSGMTTHLLGVRFPVESRRRDVAPRATNGLPWSVFARRAAESLEAMTLQLLALAAAVPGWLDLQLLYALGRRFCAPTISRYVLAEAMSSGFFERAERDEYGVLLRFRATEARLAMLSYLPADHVVYVFRFLVNEHLSVQRGVSASRLRIPLHLLMREVDPDRARLMPHNLREEMALEGYSILQTIHEAVALVVPGMTDDEQGELVQSREEPTGGVPRSRIGSLEPLSPDEVARWAELADALRSQQVVEAEVIEVTPRQILRVRVLNGIIAAIPNREIDAHRLPDLSVLVGRFVRVRMLEVDVLRQRAIASRRLVLDAERERRLHEIKPGTFVSGWVKRLESYGAFVDLDGVDALLHVSEMTGDRLNHAAEVVSLGQTLTLKVLSVDPDLKRISLSLRAISEEKRRERIRPGDVVTGRVIDLVRDAAFLDLDGVAGYLPLKEITYAAVNSASDVVVEEQELTLKVLGMDPGSGRVTVSLRAITEPDGERRLAELKPGATVTGKVQSVSGTGALIDLGGIHAFLPLIEVAYPKVHDPRDVLKEGQDLSLKLLPLTGQRLRVSLKAITEAGRLAEFQPGAVVQGRVKSFVAYGAFIDLGPVDALLHITDLCYGIVRHPSEILRIHDDVTVMVLKHDSKTGRIAVGRKQLMEDPWERVEERFPPGKRVIGKVTSIVDYGAFVELEPGVEGMVHVSELSWDKRMKKAKGAVLVGEEVEVLVLNVSVPEKRIVLSIKALKPSPWGLFTKECSPGDKVQGRIHSITDYAIFIRIRESLDGMVHKNDFSWTAQVYVSSDMFQKDDEVEAVILSINHDKQEILLGIKQLYNDPWPGIVDHYPPGRCVEARVLKSFEGGIYVSLVPGVEACIPSNEFSPELLEGERVERGSVINARVLSLNAEERLLWLTLRSGDDAEPHV